MIQGAKSILEDVFWENKTIDIDHTNKTIIIAFPVEQEMHKYLIPSEKSSRCPKLNRLPKIHKQGVPQNNC